MADTPEDDGAPAVFEPPDDHVGPGRPTKYQAEFCERAANECAQGATDFEVAQALGVHVATLYRWQNEHPEFREALKVGKEAADERVERAVYHRAVGYSYPAIKIMQNNGTPVYAKYTEHVPPDIGAATLWLTNRKPDDWRSKQSLEHTGAKGGPIEHRNVDDLTDEQLAAIAAARPAQADDNGSGSGPASTEPSPSPSER